jgi:LacI family transcriptional regulator
MNQNSMNHRRITQSDLARILQLNRSSVSLALQNSPKISKETRERILETAQRLNYRPNLAARQLKSARTHVVGLVIPERFLTLSEPVAVRTIQALANRVAEHGMILTILPTSLLADSREKAGLSLLPDALFVWGDVPADSLKNRIPDHHPALVIDPNHPSYAAHSLPAVRLDNAGGATAMTRHLVDRNAGRLLFVMVCPDHLGHRERWEGARSEWARHRPLTDVTYCTLEELSDETLRQFVLTPGGAILCSSDAGAIRLWRRLTDMGVAMPRDVKLAGFDTIPAAEWMGLTSVVFDCETMARVASEALLSMLANDEPAADTPLIPASVHVGTTT